jgi:Glycosyl transferase family 11
MMAPVVIVQLLGGLGNQMFQYALARHLAHVHGLEVVLDLSILLDHRPGTHVVNRDYALDIFQIEATRASLWQRWKYNAHGAALPIRVLRRLTRAFFGNDICSEKSFSFDPQVLSATVPPRYLTGLWQSPRYFEPAADLIRRDFTFRQHLPAEAVEIAGALTNPSSVCLNVRRADYVSDAGTADTLGFVGLDYYREADRYLRQQLGIDPRYFVFSDDLDWCRNELKWLGAHTVFVGHDLAGPKFSHYLQLMSRASHFVIPNSTFAWWAAWLSVSQTKNVIVPRQWFRDSNMDANDLCPPEWVRL